MSSERVPESPAVPDGGTTPVTEPAPSLEWRRVHPVTPAIRSWKAFVGIIAIGSWQFSDNFSDTRDFVAGGGWRWVLLAIGAVVVVAAAYSALAWRFTRYAVGEQAVHLNTGIVFRQQRQARLDRLQSVDVVRPLLARLAGLSQLTLEVAGAQDSKVELAFLKDDVAMALRAELLAKAAGVRSGAPGAAGAVLPAGATSAGAAGGSVAPDGSPSALVGAVPAPPRHEEAPERPVLEVPVGRLVGSIALSGSIVGFALMVVGVVVTAILLVGARRGSADALPVGFGEMFFLIPVAFGFVSVVWSRFSGGYGFRAAISPDGIRLAHGLLETRSQTIAPGRIQAIELTQPLLWRRAGWWRVRMNVAGYGAAGDVADSSTTLLPVGDVEQALLACWLVLPDLGTDDAVGALTEAMTGSGDEGGFTLMSHRARWIAPLTHRRNGYLVTERALVLRQGRLRRLVQIVPHERTQSLGLDQGLLARSLRVATFTVHSVSGPVRVFLENLDYGVATRLLDEQAARARQARALDRSERWMDPERVPDQGRAG